MKIDGRVYMQKFAGSGSTNYLFILEILSNSKCSAYVIQITSMAASALLDNGFGPYKSIKIMHCC